MKDHSDQWIEDRILWAARKNGLPSGMTVLYKEAEGLPPNLVASSGRTGIPVLAFVEGDNRWTVLGTNKIITIDNGVIDEVNLDEIKDVRMPGDEQVPQKSECDFLVIEDTVGITHHIWVPCGREFFALSNILKRLNNLRRYN